MDDRRDEQDDRDDREGEEETVPSREHIGMATLDAFIALREAEDKLREAQDRVLGLVKKEEREAKKRLI